MIRVFKADGARDFGHRHVALAQKPRGLLQAQVPQEAMQRRTAFPLKRRVQIIGMIVERAGNRAVVQRLGVMRLQIVERPAVKPAAHSLPIRSYTVSSAHPALLRLPLLDSPECAFTLEEPLTMAFNGRIYPEEGEIRLDGAPLAFSRPADNLTGCFDGLYRKTEPIALAAGRHVVSSQITDKCFLPVIIAEGAFSVDGALTVRHRAENDAAFTYSAEAAFDVDIPAGARRIALCYDDNRLVASLTVNGKPLGTQAFAPYRFELPDTLAGKRAHFVLTACSSHAPLFGPLDRHDGTWGNRICRPERLALPGLRLTMLRKKAEEDIDISTSDK